MQPLRSVALRRALLVVACLGGALAACSPSGPHLEAGWALPVEDPGPRPDATLLDGYIRDLAKERPIRAYNWQRNERELDYHRGQAYSLYGFDTDQELIHIDETTGLEFEVKKQVRVKPQGTRIDRTWAAWWVCMRVIEADGGGARWAYFLIRESRIYGTVHDTPLISEGCKPYFYGYV